MRAVIFVLLAAAPAFSQVTPFTYAYVTRHFDQAGNLKSEVRFLNAVNRDGSRVAVDLDPASVGTRQILDAANHRDVVVDPRTRRASIMARGGAYLGGAPHAITSCEDRFRHDKAAVVTVENTSGKIAGVNVQRIIVDHQNAQRLELFIAPSLGCEVLRSTHSMQGKTVTINTAENLHIGDPEAALFEIPPGYT